MPLKFTACRSQGRQNNFVGAALHRVGRASEATSCTPIVLADVDSELRDVVVTILTEPAKMIIRWKGGLVVT